MAPTTPDLSTAHPSTPSSTSFPNRVGPSSNGDTPPRPNTVASPSQRICHLKKKERKAYPKEEETYLRRESTMLLHFYCFAGHSAVVGAEGKRRRSQSRLPCFRLLSWWRVNPRAASGGGGVEKTRCHCFRNPEAFQHCSRGCTVPDSILGLFCNFKLFNVIFIYF